MAAAKAVWRSSSGGGDRREPAWILGFKPKRTNLHEKYDYPGQEDLVLERPVLELQLVTVLADRSLDTIVKPGC